ncbi:tetratricopeptide repeat protein [Subtercola boreus]|uniref:Co-chaperone YbbN n=1 Tax=Subtercola boreus TaxID=120213 RepID=A0A3E0WE19_9MICO|nr:tetratricopeptide repeat protein [Subtercola boreus]RFA22043.1 co-chaperone YbbN [Subtercola boreus]RFA22223.1 co-chaperone YbbN [Subtercola boreus]RFA28086.1 co-chaperone YbbN [Subtercola boreus]
MSQVPPSAASLRGAVDLSSLVNRAAAPAPGAAGAAGSGAAVGAGMPGTPGGAPGAGVSVPSLLLDATDATISQVLDLSNAVPVIVELWASYADASRVLAPVIQKLILEYGGQLVLVRVDTESNPQLTAAFQAQTVPTVAAIIAGRPVALFEGAQPEASVRDVFDQVLQLAEQNGVTGSAIPADGRVAGAEGDADGAAEPVEEPLPPHHAEAFEAISRGDYKLAIAEYEKAIAQGPRDQLAIAGLAQVKLLDRLDGTTLDAIRSGAAAAPDDIDAQLLVADLDVSGGHVEDAFDRILGLFARADQPTKDLLRTRLLDLFEVVGTDDPRVTAARRRLTMLLY